MLSYNYLGKGILSAPTVTTIPRSGASPAYTTAAGTALTTGITYRVDEQQVLRTVGCKNSPWSVAYKQSTYTYKFSNSQAPEQLAVLIMQGMPSPTTVHVERYNDSIASALLDPVTYLITFVGAKNVPLLWAQASNVSEPGCIVTTETFLEGNGNTFVIEPKQASGETLVDSATPSFEGQDLFFTESYKDGVWYRCDEEIPNRHE